MKTFLQVGSCRDVSGRSLPGMSGPELGGNGRPVTGSRLLCVAVAEKRLVSACTLSNVSHSKHSLCFLAHKTAEVHPVQ